ncbi:MAG TPA: DUF2934 domain-containing protein [Povalibacter sp.]|nr:DUF2934 domain-containing protein [Povalibacter sp.]
MQVSPATSSAARRSRAKPKDEAAVTAKKPRSRKKSPSEAETQVEMMALDPVSATLDERIATTAYFLAAERNFSPGHELDDWLEAERQVRNQLSG